MRSAAVQLPQPPRLMVPREQAVERITKLLADGEQLADTIAPVVHAFASLEEMGGERLYQLRRNDLFLGEDLPEHLQAVADLWRTMPEHYQAHETVQRLFDRWQDAANEFLISSFDDPGIAKRFMRASGRYVGGEMATIEKVRQLESQIEGGNSQLAAVKENLPMYVAGNGPTPSGSGGGVYEVARNAVIERIVGWLLLGLLILVLVSLVAFGVLNPGLLDKILNLFH